MSHLSTPYVSCRTILASLTFASFAFCVSCGPHTLINRWSDPTPNRRVHRKDGPYLPSGRLPWNQVYLDSNSNVIQRTLTVALALTLTLTLTPTLTLTLVITLILNLCLSQTLTLTNSNPNSDLNLTPNPDPNSSLTLTEIEELSTNMKL